MLPSGKSSDPKDTLFWRLLPIFVSDPLDKSILKSQPNQKYAKRIWESYIPQRVGIEFEIGRNIIHDLYNDYKVQPYTRQTRDRVDRLNFNHHEDYEVDIDLRGSNDLKALKIFYDYLNSHQHHQYAQSGIHIHTDVRYANLEDCNFKNPRQLDGLIRMLNAEYFRYGGNYNDPRFGTVKGNSIVFREAFGSIEYRSINMTWSFSKLISHIVMCSTITKEIVKWAKTGIFDPHPVCQMMSFLRYCTTHHNVTNQFRK